MEQRVVKIAQLSNGKSPLAEIFTSVLGYKSEGITRINDKKFNYSYTESPSVVNKLLENVSPGTAYTFGTSDIKNIEAFINNEKYSVEIGVQTTGDKHELSIVDYDGKYVWVRDSNLSNIGGSYPISAEIINKVSYLVTIIKHE